MSVKFGDRVTQARKEKKISREELAELIGTSAPIIGRYERGDMMPSIDIATKIAEALEVSLDFLVGKSSLLLKDKNMLNRLEDINLLNDDDKKGILFALDGLIRDAKTRKAYAT
jgi:transcriptional regulator with XRE-family HTH domain